MNFDKVLPIISRSVAVSHSNKEGRYERVSTR